MKNTALITGASSGIGRELAYIHAQNGGNLVLVARRQEKLTALKSQLEQKHDGIIVHTIIKDLSQPQAAQELFDDIQQTGVQIDCLMNNAGFGLLGKFHELPWQRQQQMIQLNMATLTELTYLFLPQMLTRNKGKILNTSSTASLMPGPLQAVYFATKAYVTSLSNALAEELRDTNVTVTNLMPGATETEFGITSGMDKTSMFQKAASARMVAQAGYGAMVKGHLDVISGLTFSQKIMMKLMPFAPKKMVLKQIRQMQEVE